MVHENGRSDRSFVEGGQLGALDKSSLTSPLHTESLMAYSRGADSMPLRMVSQDSSFLQPLHLTEQRVKPLEQGSLDPQKSLSQLAAAGLIADKSADKPAENSSHKSTPEQTPLARVSEQQVPAQVVDENASRKLVVAPADADVKADVLIRKDGTVELLKPQSEEFAGKRQLVVQLESTGSASEAQVKAAKELDSWMLQHTALVEKQAKAEAAQQEQAMRAAQEQSEQRAQSAAQKFSGDGSMSRQDADNYFPQQDRASSEAYQPEQADQRTSYQMLRDSIAALSGANNEHPYETIRLTPENGFAFGRYGITRDIYMSWLESSPEFSEILGNPPDFSKLALLMDKLAKKGKIPKEFAAKFNDPKFCAEFGDFLNKMHSGKGTLSAGEISKFMPKEMQEAVIKGVLDNAASKKIPAEQVALAMHLGKPVDKLSDADKNDPKNKELMSASLKLMGLSAARQQAGNNDRIDWHQSKDPSSPLAFRIANAAEAHASRTNTVGWCYQEVANTLDNFGVHLSGRSAYMAAPQLAKNEHFREVSPHDLKKGTVLVFGRSADHPHGHITVYLGNGREASDHVQRLVNFNAYGGVRAFEPIA